MKRSLALAVILSATLLAAPGCKRKQPPPQMPPQSVQPMGPETQRMPAGHPGAGVERKIVIPDDIRNGWKAVRLEILFRKTKEKKRFDVPLDADFQIPGSDLTVKAGPFFPDFQMDPGQITSASNRPQNPAARAEIFDGGRKIYQGWLFAKHPDIHAFTHDTYGVTLVEGIPK